MLSTPGGDSNLDNIIKKNFPTEIQQRRVKTEIQYLKELDQNCFKVSLQSTPIGLKILVNLTKNFILQEIKEAEKFVFPIVFEFLLEPKFPFVFPKLLCKTSFFTPNLADGRDFVEDVIQRMWNPSILLRDVVVYIPDFLKRLIQQPIPEESQLLGKYYLGHLYNLEDFLTMDTAHVFAGTEMINEQSVNNERYFIIIESYFLNFESVDKARNTLRLISWAHVQAISRIKRNKDDPKMLVFLWHDNDKKGVLVQNVFILDQAVGMVETIVRMGQKYAKITETIKKQRDLPLAEVTAKNYRDMDIEELLENIVLLESKLEAEPSIDVINLLMNLYQKAVEYFSAISDPAYEEFVEKLHDLLNREDIQIILKSGEGGQVKKTSLSGSKKTREKARASPAEKKEARVPEFKEPEEPRTLSAEKPKSQARPQKPEEPVIKQEEAHHVQHHVPEHEHKAKPNEKEQILINAENEAEKAAEAELKKQEEKLEEKQVEKQEEQKPEEKQEETQEEKQEEKLEAKPEEKPEEKQEEEKPEERVEEKPEEKQEEKLEAKPEEKPEEKQEEEKPEEENVQPAEIKPVEEEKSEQPQHEEKPEEAEKAEEVEVEQPKAEEPAPVEVDHEEKHEKKEEPEKEEEEKEKEKEAPKHTNDEEHTKPIETFASQANDDMFDIGDDDD